MRKSPWYLTANNETEKNGHVYEREIRNHMLLRVFVPTNRNKESWYVLYKENTDPIDDSLDSGTLKSAREFNDEELQMMAEISVRNYFSSILNQFSDNSMVETTWDFIHPRASRSDWWRKTREKDRKRYQLHLGDHIDAYAELTEPDAIELTLVRVEKKETKLVRTWKERLESEFLFESEEDDLIFRYICTALLCRWFAQQRQILERLFMNAYYDGDDHGMFEAVKVLDDPDMDDFLISDDDLFEPDDDEEE